MKVANDRQFQRVVLGIYKKLLETFPIPQQLYAEDVGISSVEDDEPEEMIGGIPILKGRRNLSADENFFYHCVTWLKQEEFITADEESYEGFRNVRLTEKALTILNAMPRCLERGYNPE